MKIEALTPFLDGTDRFEAGDIRTVSDERGYKFIAHGWAKDVSGQVTSDAASPESVDLNIQNSVLGIGDNHG